MIVEKLIIIHFIKIIDMYKFYDHYKNLNCFFDHENGNKVKNSKRVHNFTERSFCTMVNSLRCLTTVSSSVEHT